MKQSEKGRKFKFNLVQKPEGKTPLPIPGRRWENNIKMNTQL
jgi:hypothetical protein